MSDSASLFVPLPPGLEEDPLGRLVLRVRDQLLRLNKLGNFIFRDVKDDEIQSEFNRALVVFAHAGLEDTIRELVRRRWRDWPDEALDRLPYPGDRSNKATHRELKQYAGLTIEQLIEKSANTWLDTKSLSSTTDLCSLLGLIGVDLEKALPTPRESGPFPSVTLQSLQLFFERRHNIVHNGDYDRTNKHRNSLNPDTVTEWFIATITVVDLVLRAECKKHPKADALDATIESVFAEMFGRAIPATSPAP
jgi:hypothetical protein